jgi:hypothetical protein
MFNLLSQYNKPKFSDVQIKLKYRECVEEKEEIKELTIYAHKVILSQVPYFETMFDSGMKEANSSVICLEHITPAHFEYFLTIVYGGYLPKDLTIDDLMSLYYATDLFMFLPIKNGIYWQCYQYRKNNKGELSREHLLGYLKLYSEIDTIHLGSLYSMDVALMKEVSFDICYGLSKKMDSRYTWGLVSTWIVTHLTEPAQNQRKLISLIKTKTVPFEAHKSIFTYYHIPILAPLVAEILWYALNNQLPRNDEVNLLFFPDCPSMST